MTEATWLPGVVVLATGLFLGLLLAFRLRGQGDKKSHRQTESPDLQLKIRDLEARRDDLYRRIRAAEEDKLGSGEVAALENAAAHTLRELDLLNGQLPKGAAKKKTADKRAAAAIDRPSDIDAEGTPATAASPSRTPVLIGFAFGAALVAVIGLLVYWAVRDAQPDNSMTTQPIQATGAEQPPHEGQMQVPAELAAQIAELQNRLVSDPEDWLAKKQLALSYVAAGQFFEAFSQASQILQQFPEDPDGLLVHGIVRLTMGQADQSVDLLDRVLAQHPNHRQALIYRGLALYQSGKVEQALDTWEMGLQLTGGSDPEMEELIRMAQSGASQPAGMTAPDHPQTEPAAAQQPGQMQESIAQAHDPNGFSISLDLAAGIQIGPQTTLFVFLRPEAGGPPVAARRITQPRFPIEMTLGTDDSMMGAELPETGTLVARLDADGNVATADASDLAVEIVANKGQRVQLTFGQ